MLKFNLPEAGKGAEDTNRADWLKPVGLGFLAGYTLYKTLSGQSEQYSQNHVVEQPSQGMSKSRAWLSLDY